LISELTLYLMSTNGNEEFPVRHDCTCN